jgi:NTE family protein
MSRNGKRRAVARARALHRRPDAATRRRAMKTAVVFQGGGALGAFGAGAWSGVEPWLRSRGHELVAIAGASIGAFNAALLAAAPGGRPGPDVLEACWREAIAMPSWPFLGWPVGGSALARAQRSWNGLLTGTLLGNRGLYAPQPQHWGPWAEPARLRLALYQPGPMRALLERRGLRVRSAPGRPLLALAATHLPSGELRLLHGDEREIGPEHVLASAAIPGFFPPVDVDGDPHWDGDFVRSSPIPPLVALLRSSGRVGPGETLQLVTVEQFARPAARLPANGRELAFRAMSLMQAGKLGDEAPLPPAVRLLAVQRPPLPEDAVSGEFDYSPERIEALIAQGRDAAGQALGEPRAAGLSPAAAHARAAA